MARGDVIGYGFATGRVMVLRARLLGRGAFERLLDAPTFDDQRRVLADTHFGRFIEGAVNAADVERAIDESLSDLYDDFLRRAGLPAPVVAFFQSPYDFASLKSVLRARAIGVAPIAAGVVLGAVEPEAFDDPAELPGALGRVARTVLGAKEPLGPEAIDAAVDAEMFAQLERLAHDSHIPILQRLAARQIDAANAKVLLRCAMAGRRPADSRTMLVPGGTWNAAGAAALVADPTALAETILTARVLSAPAAADLLDLERLDVYVDAATAGIARDASRGPIGPEPVLGYVLQRRAEAITVRALLVGRLAGLSRDIVISRLREAVS